MRVKEREVLEGKEAKGRGDLKPKGGKGGEESTSLGM